MYFAFEIDPPGQESNFCVIKALVIGRTYLPDGVTMTKQPRLRTMYLSKDFLVPGLSFSLKRRKPGGFSAIDNEGAN